MKNRLLFVLMSSMLIALVLFQVAGASGVLIPGEGDEGSGGIVLETEEWGNYRYITNRDVWGSGYAEEATYSKSSLKTEITKWNFVGCHYQRKSANQWSDLLNLLIPAPASWFVCTALNQELTNYKVTVSGDGFATKTYTLVSNAVDKTGDYANDNSITIENHVIDNHWNGQDVALDYTINMPASYYIYPARFPNTASAEVTISASGRTLLLFGWKYWSYSMSFDASVFYEFSF